MRRIRTIESANNHENDEANRAVELTRRRSAHGPYDRIADTPTAPQKILQEDCRTHPATRLKILVPPHVTTALHDKTNENGQLGSPRMTRRRPEQR